MTKKKSTKRALISSLLILAMCFTMLAGTTFAWFTDSVTSGSNIIKSGKLDVDLLIKAKGDADYVSVETDPTKVAFDYELWEPGYTTYAAAKVVNKGNLALKYDLKITTAGQLSALAEVIDVYTGDTVPADRDLSGMTKVGTLNQFITGSIASGNLLAGAESAPFVIALQMQTTAGNEYQNLELGTFSFLLFATQYTYEADSFNDQYDANAGYIASASAANATELAAAIAAADPGAVIELTAPITDGTVDITKDVTILGNGKEIKANIKGGDVTLVNVDSKYVKVDSAYAGTLEFDGGTLSKDPDASGGDTDAPFYSNAAEGTFIFKDMEVTAGSTKGIKVSKAKEVIIDNCVFNADNMDPQASAAQGQTQYVTRSLSMIDIQEQNTPAVGKMKVTITNCTFISAPKGVGVDGIDDTDTAGAIKLKAEKQGFESVTITGNTFTNCYRDVVAGVNVLLNDAGTAFWQDVKSAAMIKSDLNNLANWNANISGNNTNGTANRGVLIASNNGKTKGLSEAIGAVIGGATVYNTYNTTLIQATMTAPQVYAILHDAA